MSDNNEREELTFFKGEYHRAAIKGLIESAGIMVVDHAHAYNQAYESVMQIKDLARTIDIAGSVSHIAKGLTFLALSGSGVDEAAGEINSISRELGKNVVIQIPVDAAVKLVMYYIQSICSCWDLDDADRNFRRNIFAEGNMEDSVAEVSSAFAVGFEQCKGETYQKEIYDYVESFWKENCVVNEEDYVKRSIAAIKGRPFEVGYMVFDIIGCTNWAHITYDKASKFWDGVNEISGSYEEEDSFMAKISERAADFIIGINQKIV